MNEPIIFGKHSIAEAEALRPPSLNPCVNEFGRGPMDKTCVSCQHLRTGAVPRCTLQKRHRHRPEWPACEKYAHKV